MRIKNIQLHNFGSYGGHNSFNFEANSPEERVVVIGGKNGAGKTTLFTAVQICLYGNFAFGFKTAGKRYLSEVYRKQRTPTVLYPGKTCDCTFS